MPNIPLGGLAHALKDTDIHEKSHGARVKSSADSHWIGSKNSDDAGSRRGELVYGD